jgi:hypothetical protein
LDGNIIVNNAKPIKVTNASQDTAQTRFYGIVNGEAAPREKVGFAQTARVNFSPATLTYNAGNKGLILAH